MLGNLSQSRYMTISKEYLPALGADYSAKMKSRYAEKVKPSVKIYTKADRQDNRVTDKYDRRISSGNK